MNFSLLQPLQGGPVRWHPRHSPYEVHQVVWTLFDDPDIHRRNFLYRLDVRPDPHLYIVSDRPPVKAPEGWSLKTTPYDPQPKVDDVLAFRVRVNATVDRSKPLNGKRAGRHSVVADALRDHDGGWRTAMLSAYRAWFERKGERSGFNVLPGFEVADHRRVTVRHKPKRRTLRFDQGDLHGVLRVTDSDAFRKALLTGLGRARAFGCGLMMIRNP